MSNEIAPMSLTDQIQQFHAALRGKVPDEITALLSGELGKLAGSGLEARALREGAVAPDFELPDQVGRPTRLANVLERGPAVVTFYRGAWCPYCNLQLRAYQAILGDIEALGATLVAISPQTPDFTAATATEKGLRFPVLSDVGNQVARRYGLVFVLSDVMQDLQKKFGNEVPRFNGDQSWELPMPGTFVVARDGIIRLASVDADHRRRLEPRTLLDQLGALR